MPHQSAAGPAKAEPPIRERHNPTVLDTVFILAASVTLLLLLFWIVSQIYGMGLFEKLPAFLQSMISSVWAKLGFGSGSVAVLILRRWIEKEKPEPNYLLWIGGCVIFLLAAVALVRAIIPPPPPPPPNVRSSIKLRVEAPAAELAEHILKDGDRLQIKFQEQNPSVNTVYLAARTKDDYTFGYQSTYATPPGGNVIARFNWVRTRANLASGKIFDYELCLTPKFRTFPAEIRMVLECSQDTCKPSQDDPGYMALCSSAALLPPSHMFEVVPSAEAAEVAPTVAPPRWVVPSLETLQRVPEAERVGFTEFEIQYEPSEKARTGDSYYYAVAVNGQPVYIDGFPPGSSTTPLVQGKNVIKFGLENLNFSGQNGGREKMKVTIVVLHGGRELLKENIERYYVALRDATPTQHENAAGTFTWQGAYIKSKNENRYEVFISSTPNPDLAMQAKRQFERDQVTRSGKPLVMVIRPPLNKNANYGLVLGEVQPSQQVQFTFPKQQALELCKWAQDGSMKHSSLNKSAYLYDNWKKGGYTACR